MRSFRTIRLKASLILALMLVSSIPQKTLAIELIPILDKVGKHAVEGAIKGFFGIEDDEDFDDDEYYDEYDEYEEYEEYEEYDDEYEEYDEYVETDYYKKKSPQAYRSGYRYIPAPPVGYPPGYGYYPNYPLPGYMRQSPPNYPSYPVYAPGDPPYSPPTYFPGYSGSNLLNSEPALITNW